MQATLILVRHGESIYNKRNLFTGWTDVALTAHGEIQAQLAGELLKSYQIDSAFTSKLQRAQHTLKLIQTNSKHATYPITENAALNERDYGDLNGLDKTQVGKKYGENQLHTWRRSFKTPPPGGESLEMTFNRCVPYFLKNIVPMLKQNKTVLIVAHGNSIRSIIMEILKLSADEIQQTEIGCCEPWIIKWHTHGAIKKIDVLYQPHSKQISKLPADIKLPLETN